MTDSEPERRTRQRLLTTLFAILLILSVLRAVMGGNTMSRLLSVLVAVGSAGMVIALRGR